MPSFFRSITLLTALLSATIQSVRADMVPTSPDGSTVAKIGSQLTTMWTKDMTGVWNDVTVQLMSGDNFHMIPVDTLDTGIDATTLAEYTFTVPEVTPTSKIYFLQFTPNTGNASQVTWTTRFTIAGTDGSTTDPANSTQPGTGDAIPWGVGSLVGAASTGASSGNTTVAASTMAAATTMASMSTSSSASSSSSSASATAAAESVTAAAAAVTDQVSSSVTRSSLMLVSSAGSAASSVTSAAAAAVTAKSAAGRAEVVGLGLIGSIVGLISLVL